jgi:hypothetical protein
MNPSAALVEAVVVGVFVLLALGILALGTHGALRALRARLLRPRIERARAAVARLDAAPELARLPAGAALDLLEETRSAVRGSGAAELRAAGAERVAARAERRTHSRRWRVRLNAVRTLALLDAGATAVPPRLGDRRPEVRAAAAEWASDHPDPAVIRRLVTMLGEDDALTRFTVMDSLVRLGAEVVEPLAEAIRLGAPAPALEVAARIADPRLEDAVRNRLPDTEPPVRAWAARALGALGGKEAAADLTSLLEDREPEVRAAAAVALGRLGHWPAAPALAQCLRDPAWRVRRDAAVALRVLGPPGRLMLERALRDDDEFARDMAHQTLDLPDVVLPA